MNKITIVEITFNDGCKQYKYLLKNEVSLKTGRQYKMIKGINRGQLIYDIITIKSIYEVDVLPDIVTKYLDFQEKKVTASFIPLDVKRELGYNRRQQLMATATPAPVFTAPKPVEMTAGQPKIATHQWFFWRVNVEGFFEEKAVFVEYSRRGSALFLLKRTKWLLGMAQKFDCSDFLVREPKIDLEEVKQYQKMAQEFLNK